VHGFPAGTTTSPVALDEKTPFLAPADNTNKSETDRSTQQDVKKRQKWFQELASQKRNNAGQQFSYVGVVIFWHAQSC
jgi:hypothetical protein